MKKQIIILVTVLAGIITAFSQSEKTAKPNYKKIQKDISAKESTFYYPNLMKRFMASDTTMTLDEKRHLYYGYIYQDTYSPYGHSNYTDSLKVLMQKRQLSNDELKNVIVFSDSILTKNPFDLRVMNTKLFAYKEFKNDSAFQKTLNKVKIIIDALLSSGNGRKKKTAFYVIKVSHEYDLLNILGFSFGGKQSLIEHYDYLTVAENPQKIEGFYFDVSPSLNSLNKMFKK